MRVWTVVLALTLVAFTVFSSKVTLDEGYWGFLHLTRREPWGLQVLLDLVIALTLLTRHMKKEGGKLGITVWPYLLAVPFLGSIPALAFYLHVEFKKSADRKAAAQT